MKIETYPFDSGCYVLAVNDIWMPGVYLTKTDAEMAANKTAEELEQIWDRKFPNPIVEADLK